MAGPAVSVQGLGKRYRIGEHLTYDVLTEALGEALKAPVRWARNPRAFRRRRAEHEIVWALRDVSFEMNTGEIVGIIGRNGAGKSTLLKILSRITQPTEGMVEVRGSLRALLEVGTGFHPELTGRENIYLNGAILGQTRVETDRKFDEIVAFAGVESFIDTPVKRYSSGMGVRLAFAIAAHLDPEVLLVDEVLAVGDAEFQKKCLGRMEEAGSQGRTVIFVSHSMASVLRLCPRVILLDHGRVIADGKARDVIRTYLESGLGTSAIREWASPEDAPGDDIVRLRAVRALDRDGAVSEEVDIGEPVDIEVEYWLRKPSAGIGPGVGLRFINEDGVVLFSSTDLNEIDSNDAPRSPGVFRSRCRIPRDLLSDGQVIVDVVLASTRPRVLHAWERDAVAFQVVDRSRREGTYEKLVIDFPGVVRPTLEWRTEPVVREPGAVADGR
jgi:lipopolysaccharide transport system ATP-binding protein